MRLTSNKTLMASTALAFGLGLCAAPPAAAQEEQKQGAAAKADRPPKPSQAEANEPTVLDLITISATMIKTAVIDSMAAISAVDQEELERIQPDTAADIFRTTPGVAASMNGDDPATAINIRGLQQYGRVVVTLDGARQDYWRVGHGSGSFYVEPELIKDATVIRGPVSNAYGSGGIGGVVSFETKDAGDFLKQEERWALSEKLGYESNGDGFTTSTTGAYRFSDDADIIGNLIYRDRDSYTDGNGDTVPWTGERITSGYMKATLRPADGHELKLGAILQRYSDQITGSSGSTSPTLSRYDTDTTNQTYTAAYTWKPDDNELIDFSANAYHNRTRAEQTQVWPTSAIGNFRYYDVATTGFNVKNSSRFDAWEMAHTLTYGLDYYYLEASSEAAHFGAGEQQGYGGFLQWQGDYDNWLQLIAAMRYDGYQLDGETKTVPPEEASMSGDRWSPRLTVGVTPLEGFQLYGTYSEGYRAPGLQDVYRGGGAHGSGDTYVPNLLLQPETARNWEAGVNLKYDDILAAGDLFRAKVNVFHTDVEDYIEVDLRPDVTRTAINIGDARLKGIEAEAVYDYGWGFVNLAGALIDAKVVSGVYSGQALTNTPLDRFSATLGFRMLEDQLTVGAQYLSVGKITRTNRTQPNEPTIVDDGFDLINVFANWRINDHAKLDFAVDNVFDTAYTDPQSAWSTSAATEQGKGRTFKVALTGRIGG
ncbi:TonB-dependent hemoglobin/transferrin/lactoferrin family receptor [Mesorhizobium mediterraneum]|uniref:TonB-dependent heme/hemoglobin receptor family protein n=1 Tax=Mesorhizobium mediterraneum TaxID=43617 RepID=A0AB36RH32_9HYPH|nr:MULTISPECIES: TonB-dependent hemoglobin/transferrin/lactoferrin family receptor [Mesorhizobium]PAQ04049.1 TonB-dependent heme/hemoglobin receptor family protein [Mesorhizobium mediterraneum]RWN31608.1 MAG: TonB-dependent hemoglobin/transferrin/lactoferrin family receptor [Mesorhizobium sp.]RWO94916.1 MAG: TonB-dependent hemoglobin/transferrin/lactoferrin family receptor [Mesorhizobium sp.]WIW56625.1 TonB-dependent hemoglobin/transferrin/lactoferrin family receptor [Mesorhizobium mediterraneu